MIDSKTNLHCLGTCQKCKFPPSVESNSEGRIWCVLTIYCTLFQTATSVVHSCACDKSTQAAGVCSALCWCPSAKANLWSKNKALVTRFDSLLSFFYSSEKKNPVSYYIHCGFIPLQHFWAQSAFSYGSAEVSSSFCILHSSPDKGLQKSLVKLSPRPGKSPHKDKGGWMGTSLP